MKNENILDLWGIDANYLTALVTENPSLRGMISGYIAEKKLNKFLQDHGRTESHRKDDDHDRGAKGDLCVTYKGHEFRIEVKSLQTNSVFINGPGGDWLSKMNKKIVGRKPSEGRRKNGEPRLGKPIYKWFQNPEFENLPEAYRLPANYKGMVQCDGSDRRNLTTSDGSIVNTTLLKRGEFDILAACIFTFRERWEFGFALNEELPTSSHRSYDPAVQDQLIASLVEVTLPLKAPFVSDPFILLEKLATRKSQTKSSFDTSGKPENTNGFSEHELAFSVGSRQRDFFSSR